MASAGNLNEMLPMSDGLAPVPYQNAPLEAGNVPASAGTGLSPGEIWRILKQRKITVIVTFLLLMALSVLTTFLVLRYAPAYPAVALMELTAPEDPMQIAQDLADRDSMKLLLETEARKIKNPSIFNKVIALPEIKSTNFYNWYKSRGEEPEAVDDMMNLVSVAPIPDSQLIRIAINLRHKDEAVKVVRSIVDQYLQTFQQSERDATQQRLEEFKERREELNRQLRDKRKELSDFRSTTDIPVMPTQGGVLVQNIGNITDQLTSLRAAESQYALEYEKTRGINQPDLIPISAEDQLIIEADPILRFYRQQVEQFEIQMKTLISSGRVGPKHRDMATLQAQRDEYYAKEIARRDELIDQLRGRKLDNINIELQRVRTMIAQLSEELADAEAKQRDINNGVVRYQEMTADELQIRQDIAYLTESIGAAEVAVAANKRRPRLRLVSPPEEAVRPSRPNLVLWLGAGFFLSILGAAGLALLREVTDTAVRTPMHIERECQMPLLGTIPEINYEEADIDDIETATRLAPQSLVAESFRQARARLMFSGPMDSQRVLLMVSPGPENGTSACAINLAVTFAQSNQRVLLIDCNFRRPSVRSTFRNTKSEGLSNVLIGQKKLADVISQTEHPNLDVVTTGRMPPAPAELLGSSLMGEVIKEAAQTYSRVVLDGPPALLYADSLVLATQVDGVVMVARAVDNKKGELKRARDQILRIGGRIVGCILNGVQARAGGYFKKQYREFYDYASDEQVEQELLLGADEEDHKRGDEPPVPDPSEDDGR